MTPPAPSGREGRGSRKGRALRPRPLPAFNRKMSLAKIAAVLGVSPRTIKRAWPDYRKQPERRYGQYMGYEICLWDIMDVKLFIVSKAAPLLGLTTSQTRREIRRGNLLAHKIPHYYGNTLARRIQLGEIIRYREENRQG